MALPFTKQWRIERRQERETQRAMLLREAKERDFSAKIAAVAAETSAAEKVLNKTSKKSPEWSQRNQEFVVAKGKQQMAELELAAWKANNTFEELEQTKIRFNETTAKLMKELDDARKKK